MCLYQLYHLSVASCVTEDTCCRASCAVLLLFCMWVEPLYAMIWTLLNTAAALSNQPKCMWQERGEVVGNVVGYSVRLESKTSLRTRLLFCTTGLLLTQPL